MALPQNFTFPYASVNMIYLDCGINARLLQQYSCLITCKYQECMPSVIPCYSTDIKQHVTPMLYPVKIVPSEQFSFINEVQRDGVFPQWQITENAIVIPYGDINDGYNIGSDMSMIMIARVMRNLTRAIRLLPNPTPSSPYRVDISIPWIPIDIHPGAIETLSNRHLAAIAEMVIAYIAGWISRHTGKVIFDSTEITPCINGCYHVISC